ncbi:hypothetical protein CsatA_022789 [Cannabis sativa]
MDIFLRPLVDELKELWNNGVPTRDSSTNSMFTMCAALLWTVNDFPARSSLSGWSGQGYKACPTCNEDTTSIRVIGKTSYVRHRRFLPSNHAMRRDTRFDGKVERRPPPRRFTCEEILSQVNNLEPQIPGHHENFGGVKRRRVAETCNWRKKSIFYELEYWSTNILKHNIDVMHVEKNVCDSLLGTILDNDKSKDTTNARHDLKKMGIRESLWIYEDGNGRLMKPHAPYVLTREKRQLFCQFVKGIKFPDGFCSNLKSKVSPDDSNIIGLKSHDCHVIMQRVLAVGVRKFLPRDTATTITQLCNFFRQLCSRTLNVKDMEDAQNNLTTRTQQPQQLLSVSAATDAATEQQPHPLQSAPTAQQWRPPDVDQFKLNVDETVDTPQNVIGVGTILSDSNGHVVAAFSKKLNGNFSSHEMEATTLFQSLNWAIQQQLPLTQIKTDALMVVSALRGPFNSISSFNDLIVDISCLLSFLPNVTITHVKRTANMAAHGLAKFALGVDETCL